MPHLARRLLALLVIGFAVLATAAPADAQITRKKAIWGPAIDENFKDLFPLYKELGVGLWQTQIRWEDVAPTKPANPRDPEDPAYQWPNFLDRFIGRANDQGIQVSAAVLGAPGWANGGRAFNGAPNDVEDYADFIEAAARRYPRIEHWMVWAEPSKSDNFLPQQGGKEIFACRPRARLYARMLDLSYRRLKSVSRANKVIGGNSFNSSLKVKGYCRPGRWMRELRMPNGKPPRMDMYGHNPFTYRRPNIKSRPQGKDLLDLNDADTMWRLVDRYIGRGPNRKGMKLFFSEYFVPTDGVSIVNFFVSQATQRRWVRGAYRLARRQKRIYTLGYWKLYDSRIREDGLQVRFGLLRLDGSRKGGFFGYKEG